MRGLILALSALLSFALSWSSASAAETLPPFAPAHEFVVIADRPVCSVLGSDQNGAGVFGQDGSSSVNFLGRSFWGFADTLVGRDAGPPNQPNGLGYAEPPAEDPAADCIDLQHKRDASDLAVPLLEKQPGECAVWPAGLAAIEAPNVHVFYLPITDCDPESFSMSGVGLAKFDATTIGVPMFPSQRITGTSGVELVWPSTLASGGRPLVNAAQPFIGGPQDGYLYLGLHGPAAGASCGFTPFSPCDAPRLARVARSASALEACIPWDAPACQLQYWNPATGAWQAVLSPQQELFVQPLGLNGGVMFGYNSGLARWVATYTSGLLFDVRMRISSAGAPSPTGAWSEEVLASYCPHFFLSGFGYCYTGTIHPEYEINGGNTLYVTMATNRFVDDVIDDYSVFIHELTIGKPVVQSVAPDGRRRYRVSAVPSGFVAEGTAFYASSVSIPGFDPIYEWSAAGRPDLLLGAAAPNATHIQRGSIVFYAPARMSVGGYANAYEPVYRWDRNETEHIYSPLLGLEAYGYANTGPAFYTSCGDADFDYLSDCAELNSDNDPRVPNLNVDGDCLVTEDASACQVNDYGVPIVLGNAQSVAQDDGERRADIDNCPLVQNPLQENTDSGDIATDSPFVDVTTPLGDVLGDACDPDQDNDGLGNAQESAGCNASGATSASDQDSDGDHAIDGFECILGSNPTDSASTPTPPVPGTDADFDGISDSVELLLGTTTSLVDTDGDGLTDLVESRNWGTDPTRADTDGDGCGDLFEAATVNEDWSVDPTDRQLVALHFGVDRPGSGYYIAFDVNRDGKINATDLALIVSSYGFCDPPRHVSRTASRYGDPGATPATSTNTPTPGGTPTPTNTSAAAATPDPTLDSDGDGCTDIEESGPSAALGGRRNPFNPWDFFDVNGSAKVDAADIALVRFKFNSPGPTAPADLIYDRTSGAYPWAPGPPNNVIDSQDIGLVRLSYHHSCQAPP